MTVDKDISIDIKWKDYEWQKYTTTNVENLYELIKWEEYNGKKSCYVIVFIRYNAHESYWELDGGMNRWLDIPEEDIIEVNRITKKVIELLNATTHEEE